MAREPFYQRFRETLERLGVAEEAAAVEMGVKIDVVRRLLKGAPGNPRMDEGLKFCEKHDLDPWQFSLGRVRRRSIARETESLGPSLGALEASVEQVLEKLGQLESRIGKLETAPVKGRGTRRKGALQ